MCTASNWPRTGLWTELRVYHPTSHANRRRSRGGDLNAAASAAVNAKPSSIHIARGGALALAHRPTSMRIGRFPCCLSPGC